MPQIDQIYPAYQILISLGLGLLVGLQREWAESPLGGIRTFALIAMLGSSCALLAGEFGVWIVAAGFLATTLAVVLAHFKKTSASEEGADLAAEFAMLLMFACGALVGMGPLWPALVVAGVLTVILQAKSELHFFVARFNEKEIKAIVQFVLLSLVIFPLVPNQDYGPLGVLNPHDIWIIVMLIVGLSLVGYIIYKFFGQKAGVLLSGILGGLISSTATTLGKAKEVKHKKGVTSSAALVILLAWSMTYIRLFIEIVSLAPSAWRLWPVLSLMFMSSALPALILWWRWHQKKEQQKMAQPPNPTELKGALMFALIFSLILIAVALSKEHFGQSGLRVTALISGLVDVDAITLSTVELLQKKALSLEEAGVVILLAAISNTFFKGMLAAFVGGFSLFKALLPAWILSLATGSLLFFFPELFGLLP